jgi:antiviral helicase SKI2
MDNYPQIAGEGKRWPVLRLDDGGLEVHKLQVLLDDLGYYSGEEDMQYWYFGSTTENALGTFQVRSKHKSLSPIARFQHLIASLFN